MGTLLLSGVTSSGNSELAKVSCKSRSSQGVLELLENMSKTIDTNLSNSSTPRNNNQLLHIEINAVNPLQVEAVKYNILNLYLLRSVTHSLIVLPL